MHTAHSPRDATNACVRPHTLPQSLALIPSRPNPHAQAHHQALPSDLPSDHHHAGGRFGRRRPFPASALGRSSGYSEQRQHPHQWRAASCGACVELDRKACMRLHRAFFSPSFALALRGINPGPRRYAQPTREPPDWPWVLPPPLRAAPGQCAGCHAGRDRGGHRELAAAAEGRDGHPFGQRQAAGLAQVREVYPMRNA